MRVLKKAWRGQATCESPALRSDLARYVSIASVVERRTNVRFS